jgi:hypothetical protein
MIVATALTALNAPCAWSQTPKAEPTPARSGHATLSTQFGARFTGDFDAAGTRRLLRMGAPYSRTLFFRDKGALYGTTADGAYLLEEWINKTFKLGTRPLSVTLTPVSRDKLFDTLLAGDCDVAAGNITITEERRKRVAFTAPIRGNVNEIIVTDGEVPDLDSPEALGQRGRHPTLYQLL